MATPAEIQAELIDLQNFATNQTSSIRTSTDYTRAGREKAFHATVDRLKLREELDTARQKITDWHASTTARAEKARAEYLPTAGDDHAAIAAELAVARILGRGTPDLETITDYITTTPPGPTRTLFIEEVTARGLIGPTVADAALDDAHPELKALHDEEKYAAVTLNALTARVNGIERIITDVHADKLNPTETIDVTKFND